MAWDWLDGLEGWGGAMAWNSIGWMDVETDKQTDRQADNLIAEISFLKLPKIFYNVVF